jgi:hypothetical protein
MHPDNHHFNTIALCKGGAIEDKSKFVNIRKGLNNTYADWMLFGEVTHS